MFISCKRIDHPIELANTNPIDKDQYNVIRIIRLQQIVNRQDLNTDLVEFFC